jgi:DNA-directed RNA polymerase specialized sigma24 family protein
MAELPFPWNIYEAKQKQLKRSHRLTDQTWGIENGLNALLTAVESGSLPKNQDDAQRELDRNIASRTWTERNRARLRRKYIRPAPETDPRPQHHPASFSPAQTEGQLHAIIRVSQIRGDMTSAEWDLIVRVRDGFDCQEIALESGVSAGNIRTRLSRLRSRFKMAA